MKTKNDLKTGILIGIGMIVVPLLLMSTTYVTNKQSKYEIHDVSDSGSGGILLNTETGQTWSVNSFHQTQSPLHVYPNSSVGRERLEKEKKNKK